MAIKMERERRMVVMTAVTIRYAKFQSNSHHQQPTPVFMSWMTFQSPNQLIVNFEKLNY